MDKMQKSITEHLWKIHETEIELARCKKGTPHYRDTKKHLFRLNKELKMAKKYLDVGFNNN